MKIIYISLVVLFSSLTGCETTTADDRWNPVLPPITQTGENTFGCKINGVIMVPRDSQTSQLGGPPTGVTYIRFRTPQNTQNCDWVEAFNRQTSRGGVAFKLPEIETLLEGVYLPQTITGGGMSISNPNIVYMGAAYHSNVPTSGYSSVEGTGAITITRYDDEVISGTFYCTLKNNVYPDVLIEVTEGRFDFNKSTINTTNFR